MSALVAVHDGVRRGVLVTAALLFVGVFLLRAAVSDPDEIVTLLFAVPVALIAVELGIAWGLAAATLALGLFGVWDFAWNDRGHSTLDYLIRAAVLFVLGGVVGLLADRLRRASRQSASAGRFLDSVLENLPNMVFVKDAAELRFVRFNRAGEELLGVSRDELIAKTDHDLFPTREADAFVQKDRDALASEGVVDVPCEQIQTPRGPRILHTRKTAIRDEHGEALYVLGISEDITDRQLAERAADAARAEAVRANQAKSEFLSRMSHELRTPLNAVIGFGQLLEFDDLDARQRESVQQILKAGRHLLELINEVLDISRIESGTMSMSLEPVHLGGALADALSLIRPIADEADVRLICDSERYETLSVLADQQRLKQVLINLLSNAVKYNRRGGEVLVNCTESGDRVQVAVADSGHGMIPEQLERLFEPFDRLGAERSGVEGTGLGLSLCRGLMDAMGGTISAESECGRGTTLRLELLRAEALTGDGAADGAATTTAAPLQPCRIVYIEDNLTNLKLIERLLARVPDAQLIAAMQATLGINLVRQHCPDVVFLDLHLPDMHGRDVLDELKADPLTAEIPVVVLSADASPGQVVRLREAGAAAYLTKPLDARSLLATLESIWPGVPVGGRSRRATS